MMSFRGTWLQDLRLIGNAPPATGTFGVPDIERQCPSVGRDLIRRVMNHWRDEGRLVMLARRDARWRKQAGRE